MADAMKLELVCVDLSHKTKRAIVGTLWREENLDSQSLLAHPYVWRAKPSSPRSKLVLSPDGRQFLTDPSRAGTIVTQLRGSETWDLDTHGIGGEKEFVVGGRTQLSFRCPLCKTNVPATAEKLNDVLSAAEDTLRHANQTSITLAWLARRLN